MPRAPDAFAVRDAGVAAVASALALALGLVLPLGLLAHGPEAQQRY